MAQGTVGVASVVLKLKDSQKFKQGLASCKAMFQSVGNAIKQIAKGIAIAWGVASAAAIKFAKSAIDAAKDWETVQMSFESMLGKQGAKDYTNWLQNFALVSPFEQTELLGASRTLMAFGFTAEQVKYTMQQLGGAVAASGNTEMLDRVARALGKINAQGKVTAESMMWLTDAQVNGWQYLADGYGKTVSEVMEMSRKGMLDSATTIPMLLEGMGKQYGDAMGDLANTTNGKISTMQDTWHELLLSFGQILLPYVNKVVDWITSAISVVTDYIENNKDKIAGFIEKIIGNGLQIGQKVVVVVLAIVDNIKKMAPILTTVQNTAVIIYNIFIGLAQVIGNIVQGLVMVGTGIGKALSGEWSGIDGAESKRRWYDENAAMFKSINEQFKEKYLSFAKPLDQLEEEFSNNDAIKKAQDFFNNFNQMVAQKTEERQRQMAKAGESVKNPGFGTPKTNTNAIVDAYKEMYKKLEEMAKNYRDKLDKWGVNSWATQIFGGIGQTMNQVYNATVTNPQEKQIDLLQEIANNTGGIEEANMFNQIQSIPMEGYNAF